MELTQCNNAPHSTTFLPKSLPLWQVFTRIPFTLSRWFPLFFSRPFFCPDQGKSGSRIGAHQERLTLLLHPLRFALLGGLTKEKAAPGSGPARSDSRFCYTLGAAAGDGWFSHLWAVCPGEEALSDPGRRGATHAFVTLSALRLRRAGSPRPGTARAGEKRLPHRSHRGATHAFVTPPGRRPGRSGSPLRDRLPTGPWPPGTGAPRCYHTGGHTVGSCSNPGVPVTAARLPGTSLD